MAKVALELQPICGKRSGIGTYTYELACRLKDHDGLEFQGNIFNFFGKSNDCNAAHECHLPIKECKAIPYWAYRRIWHVVPLSYSELFPRADLNLFFSYVVPPRVEGKTIITIHDLTHIRAPETMKSSNYKYISKNLAYSIERSEKVIAISEFTRSEVHELLQVPMEKICVIPCAPSFGTDIVPLQRLAERYGITTPYLLYVGTIEPRKNLVRLIRAFERLKREAGIRHQLVLAGGSGWNNEEIYRTAAESPYARDILFTGFVSAAEKNALYKNAAAFVFPTLYEGFGIPPLEAMHFGCPVVTSNAASLPEVVGNAAHLVDPLSEISIAEGIFQLLSDKSYCAALTANGYVQEKKYTWESSADKLTQLCREILEEK